MRVRAFRRGRYVVQIAVEGIHVTMHDDQLPTGEDVAAQLVQEQFPQWAHLELRAVESTGTSNAMYRMGDEHAVRLPLRPGGGATLALEAGLLPYVADALPVSVPAPFAVGIPTVDFPEPWAVVPWLPGVDAISADVDPEALAVDLAVALRALWSTDVALGPAPAASRFGRGIELAVRDDFTTAAIDECTHLVDAAPLRHVWSEALDMNAWAGPPTWVHGDIASGNLLITERRLSAIIDWSAMAAGDPAVDLIVAWELFDTQTRPAFRDAIAVDDATWNRGRGWALSTAIHALPYYEDTNRFMVDQALHKLDQVLAD